MVADWKSHWLGSVTLLLLFSASSVSMAAAQTASASPSRLDAALTPGRTVWLTDTSGREEKVRVVNLSGGIVTIAAGDATRRLPADEVARVRVRHADSLLNGALIGAGAAVASGLYACTLIESWENCRDDVGPITQIGAIGAGAGIAIDALVRGRRTIYEAAPGTKRLSIAPMIGRRSGGIRAMLDF